MPYYNETRVGGAMDAGHIYYNINISNDFSGTKSNGQSQSTANTEQQLTFNQTRAQPYLINPSEYYMSVQRLTIEAPWLPVLLVQPIVGQSDITKTIYSFSIDYNGAFYTSNVPWVNATAPQIPYANLVQNSYLPTPSGPVTSDYYTNPYYYCYSYNFFLDQLNAELYRFMTTLMSASSDTVPVISFNPQTKLFTIMGKYDSYRTDSDGNNITIGTGGAPAVKLYFNTELYNLFSSLPAIYRGNTLPNGADYQILFNTGDNQVPPTNIIDVSNNVYVPTVNFIYKTQDYSSLPLWSPIKSIVVRASLLNVVAENIATPVIYENGSQNINQGKQNTNILPILLEFSIPLNIGTEYRPYIFYQPTGEYRLSDLYGDIPLDGLQFDVFWKDTFGNLIPLQLAMGASATMKILFRKKIFNSDQV
jgi:hypothetical protein